MKAMTVVYDEQLGKYYKVDKNTGQTLPVEKNGQPIKQFQAEYTGRDYRLRKVSASLSRKGKRVSVHLLSPIRLSKSSTLLVKASKLKRSL